MKKSAANYSLEVQGQVAPGYEGVAEAFRNGLEDTERSGAALSIWRDGIEVVNVWAGTANGNEARAWAPDTTNVVFSCSKGLSAILLARLHEQGRLNLLEPIRELWPEFDAFGKGALSIADVLAHRAGVSVPPADVSLDDVLDSRRFAEIIAAQKPLWAPGTGHTYHAITFGTIVQELIRRATGDELYELFAKEICEPLGADLTFKVDAEGLTRMSRIITTPEWQADRTNGTASDDEMIGRALSLNGLFPRPLVQGDLGFNDPRVITAGVAGAGAVGTASALARIWSATVRPTLGVSLLSDDARALMTEVRSEGPWVFNPGPPYHRFGAGVQLSSEVTPWVSPRSFGHDGAGGQSGFADPEYGVALGYVTNRMHTVDRVAPIVEALTRIIAA